MSQLALHFLGAPRIERDGRPVAIGYNKAVALLVYLAVTQQYHTREALATLLWPDYDPAGARGEVRRMIWALNKSLGKEWLAVDRDSVALLPQPGLWLDVDHFRRLLKTGRFHGHPAGEVCPACLEPLTEAVALVRGDFLAGFTLPDSPAFDTWQRFETESLRRELVTTLERLVQLYQAHGQAGSEPAIDYARRWVALDPLQEQAHRQLMHLYAQSGQSAAALRQYQACTQALADELGVEPSSETTALYDRIRRGDLSRGVETISPPLSRPLAPLHNLPVQLTPFIGRRQEMEAVGALLLREDARLITLTGVGGTGKTRLALQVAASLLDHFEDGIYFVPLADLSDPSLVPPTIAKQLGVQEGGSPPLLEILKSSLHDKHMLLILDNFEHVLKAGPFIAELLAAVSRLKVLVTSRALLHLRGEREFMVPPLQLPARTQVWSLQLVEQVEAVQLFAERAQAAQPDFILTGENALAVAQICYRLDGLPLAIELAAARVKLLPPPLLLARLDSRLKLLTGGAQDLPARQQTLRNTIDWSYSLLTDAEQTLFARLAVFVGGFTLDTAELICNLDSLPTGTTAPGLDVLEGVTSLLNNSLLIQQETSGSRPRFRMLETIREYALERLAESGQLEALQQQHAHYFAGQIDRIWTNLNFHKGHWLDWAEEEYNNLQATLTWSQARPEGLELGLRMVGVLYWFWYRRGYISEGRTWCQRFMALTGENQRTMSRALFLVGSGLMALMQGDLAEAGQQLQESIAISREFQDERWLTAALTVWGILARFQGDTVTAQRTFEETLALGERHDLWWFVVLSLLNLGNVAATHGDFNTARNRLEQAAGLAKSNDDTWLMAGVLNNLGEVARMQGDYRQAQHCYVECQALRKMSEKPDIARLLHNLGYVTLRLGDCEQARANFKESLRMFQEMGNKRGMAECVAGLAGLAAAQDRPHLKRAARLLAAAEAQLRAAGASWWPADQVEYERTLALIQAALDPETFTAAWTQGQAMSLAEAISEALD